MLQELHILDTETASLHGGVVELAYLVLDTDLNIKEEVCVRVNPERPIDPFAQAVHGISDEDVADCPTLAEVSVRFKEPIIYIGHNCSFDQRMTAPYIMPKLSLCTLALAREHIKGTTNKKLATLQKELNLPPQKSHSALGDVHTTRDLLLYILSLTGLSLQQLLDKHNLPKLVAKYSSGPYKGMTILSTPKEYRNMLLAGNEINKDMRFTLEKMKDL